MKVIQVLENYAYPLKFVEKEKSKFSMLLNQEAEFVSANIEVEIAKEELSKPSPKKTVRALVLLKLQADGLQVIVFEDIEKEPTSTFDRKQKKDATLEIRAIDNTYYLETYFPNHQPKQKESGAEYLLRIESRKNDAKFCSETLTKYASISNESKIEIDNLLIESDHSKRLEKLKSIIKKLNNTDGLKKVAQLFNEREEVYNTLTPGSPFIDYVHTMYKGSDVTHLKEIISATNPDAEMWREASEFAVILSEYSKKGTVHYKEVKRLLDSKSVLEFLDKLPVIAQKITDKEGLKSIAKSVFIRESMYFLSLIKLRYNLIN